MSPLMKLGQEMRLEYSTAPETTLGICYQNHNAKVHINASMSHHYRALTKIFVVSPHRV